MELNEILSEKLTQQQKVKFERDNGKFKLLRNIVILPIVTTILGIYLESIVIVSISIICIIAFLIFNFNFIAKKNKVFDEVIVPYVFEEKFKLVNDCDDEDTIKEEYEKSRLSKDYDKIEIDNSLKIQEDKYYINISKLVTHKMDIEENDGVVDKNLEQNFYGIFAYVKLPDKFENEFAVIKNQKELNDLYNMDKTNTEYLKMNNIDFDMQYDVFSMNQVSVKRILSPGVMARILEINKKMNNVINFSVYNDTLYIVIEYEDFLNFEGEKEYVDEKKALENLEIIDQLDYFVRYFVNMTQV